MKNDSAIAWLDSINSYAYFGESSLSKDQYNSTRSATVMAATEVECLAIGRASFFNIFGNEVENIVIRNNLRRMFRDSMVFRNFNLIQMEKCINQLKTRRVKQSEVILSSKDCLDKVLFIIDQFQWKDKLGQQPLFLQIINDIGFYNGLALKYPQDIIAVSAECKVLEIDYAALQSIIGHKDLESAFSINKQVEEMYFKTNRVIPRMKDKELYNLSYIKTLGTGGQGVVALVQDEEGKLSALKVFPRFTLNSKTSMRMLRVDSVLT